VEFQKLIDNLEDHEDVQAVYHNGELEGRKGIYSKISNGDVKCIKLPKPLNT